MFEGSEDFVFDSILDLEDRKELFREDPQMHRTMYITVFHTPDIHDTTAHSQICRRHFLLEVFLEL